MTFCPKSYSTVILNSRQKIQLFQAINDHRDKSYDVIEGLTRSLISSDSNGDRKKERANPEEEGKKVKLKVTIGAEAESGGEDDEGEDEEDDDNVDDDDDDEGDDVDDEQEKQEEPVNNCKGRQEKNEETPFQASFISQLERVSPRLSNSGQNSSSWHLEPVGSNVLFPELNETNNRSITEAYDYE